MIVGAQINAQQDFYALTGKDATGIKFNDFRAMDAKTGTSKDVVFGLSSSPSVFSQMQKGKITENVNSYNNSKAVSMATLAFDGTGNNLVYMPLYSTNIYVLNVATKEITLVENNLAKVTPCDVGSQFTRMATGYDGNIYAMNNAGTQFAKISKVGGQYQVQDLGIIKDAASNGENSFNQMKTGFGGDMIVDADNNFYVFAAFGNVFKVSTQDLTARFIGKVSGLPNGYSVNGAAVDKNGKVVIASAIGAPMYEVDMETLQSKQVQGGENVYVYDLASKYYLNDNKANSKDVFAGVEVYPTRITDREFNVSIQNKALKGNVKVEVFDLSGKSVLSKTVSSRNGALLEKIQLNNAVNGAYLVNITDASGKVLSAKKVLIAE